MPLLAPANQMGYDPQQFYNAALAIVAGGGAAALSFRLLPPLSPAFRTRRLLALTLRDLRRLATGPVPGQPRIGKAASMAASRRCRSRPSRCSARSFWRRYPSGPRSSGFAVSPPGSVCGSELDAALEAVARATARSRPNGLPGSMTAWPLSPAPGQRRRLALRARGSILAISEALIGMPPISTQERPVRFTEIDLFGVYVAPISLMMVVAWLVTIALRRVASRFGLLR